MSISYATISSLELLRRRSPATSTIGLSLLRRCLLLSTSAVPSSLRPRLSRASSACAHSSRPPPCGPLLPRPCQPGRLHGGSGVCHDGVVGGFNIVACPGQEGKGRRAVKELPFWSLAFAISVSRAARSILGLPVTSAGGRGWRGLVIATIEFSGACVTPALAWVALGTLVALRYNGLFCPVGEISS
jgi:hypothetical protein